MTSWQPLQPDELDDPGSGYESGDGADALRLGRELESASILDPVVPGAAFVDSVMAAIEHEPTPRAALAIAGPIRRSGIGGIVESVRAALAMASLGAGRPLAARAAAMGYLLVVGVLGLTLGGGAAVGAAGALGLFDDRGPDQTPIVLPSPSPSPDATPTPTLSPLPSPDGSGEPSESPDGSGEPSESPDGSGEPSGAPSKSPTPTGSADASESPDASGSPESSRTPRPSDTPKPSETPH